MQPHSHPAFPSEHEFDRIAARYFVVPTALWVAAILAAVLLSVSAASAQDSRFDDALAQYEVGHYRSAFATFATLADEGHCEAARIAREMVRYGNELYAAQFEVAPSRLERWQQPTGCPTTSVAARR